MKQGIYLDYNATSPMDPLVFNEMLPYLKDDFGNPSSKHYLGFRAKKAIETARSQVAELIGANPDEIVFTSGGSEANSTIIKGIALQKRLFRGHIITSSIEHPSILRTCEFLQKHHGYDVTYLPVSSSGVIDPDQVKLHIRPDTVLVTVMMVNSEVGSIQPIKDIAKICKDYEVHFHCDAVQAVAKIPIDVKEIGVDSLSISAHKFYGPKGIGCLYIRDGYPLWPLINGGGQENGLRSGTENTAGIVGFGAAAKLAKKRLPIFQEKMFQLRNLFLDQLDQQLNNWTLNSNTEECIPSTINLCFPGVRGEALQAFLNQYHIYVSVASACSSSNAKLSHVLQAMGKSEDIIRSSIRISLGFYLTEEEMIQAVNRISLSVNKLRSISSKPA